ncbi:MAG: CBU_0592 family membrane protein [Acidimicrobiales bacterium]
MYQVVQVAGSLLVLFPFALVQLGRWSTTQVAYLAANLAGSAALAAEASLTSQWGFLLLEGVWAAVSLVGLTLAVTARHRPA